MRPLGTGDPIRLGPYRLLGVLGEGGMGKVYVGQDHAGTVAAVKVLRPELAHDAGLAQRFVREALAAAAVRSPGVAAVLGAQTEGGRPWIATEFLAGPTLDQIVDRLGPLDDAGLRALAVSVARTLRDIHAAGFVHRDLKPPNIVLTANGPRVIDFGIARPEHGLTLTTTGQIPVTPGYGAPEQVLGHRVTAAADVFSLGAVLVYAATGHRAFDGTHVAAVQYEVVHGEPRWHGLPPEQHALIAPCLAKEAAGRPTPEQIAGAFAAPGKSGTVWKRGPVADAIRERERAVRELTAPLLTTRTGVGPSRRRLLTGVAAGGALLAASGGTGWWLLRDGGSRDKDLFTLPPAVKTPTARVLSADDGDFIVGDAVKPLWNHGGAVGSHSPAPLPVRDVVIAGAKSGGIAAFNVVDGKQRWRAPGMEMASGYLSLSDRLLVTADSHGTLHTFVPSTGEPKWTAQADAEALLAVDQDAVYVVTKDHRLRAVGRSDAGFRWTVPVPERFRTRLCLQGAVDSGTLVVATTGGDALAVSTQTGRTLWTVYDQAKKTQLVPVAANGVFYLNGKTLTGRRASDGKEVWRGTNESGTSSEWGPAGVHDDCVYANVGGSNERFSLRKGGKDWFGPGGTEGSPVLFQGNGIWLLEDLNDGLSVHTLSLKDGTETWYYDPRWIDDIKFAADGNRVFVTAGDALIALPVF
ncbi:protein kinase [Streptomyces sp. FXJ1.172]|uniref:protein kinase domain-containing protein n=1 Tax=Streptomyces sp. FXJ1.172 TaxID=710705 RepID=UPI0007D00239|nr:protein kinase [Streptomyces sp. FXJ1.172]WEO94929.1 protein kinase [Streptomyces sp. FXJ1.172]